MALKQPFRKGSTESAFKTYWSVSNHCTHIVRNQEKYLQYGIDYPELNEDIRSVIGGVMDGSIKNEHFFSQSYFMGNNSGI